LGQENIAEWPFWQVGQASFARGRAYALVGGGSKAEVDFKTALEFVTDKRIRLRILRLLGNNREKNLKDDDAALEAYRQLMDEAGKDNGSAAYFGGIQDATRILRRRGKYDDAIAMLRRVDVDKLRGY